MGPVEGGIEMGVMLPPMILASPEPLLEGGIIAAYNWSAVLTGAEPELSGALEMDVAISGNLVTPASELDGAIVQETPFPPAPGAVLVGAQGQVSGGLEMDVEISGELVGAASQVEGYIDSYFWRPTDTEPTMSSAEVNISVDDFQELPALEFHQIIRRLVGL